MPIPDSCIAANCVLFDHLIGQRKHRWRNLETKDLGGLEIDDKFEFGRLHDRQIGRLFASEDFAGINTALMDSLDKACAVAQQTTSPSELTREIHGRHSMLGRQRYNLIAAIDEKWIVRDD